MKEKLTVQNNNGDSKEFDILFTFESNHTHKNYVTYTDYSKDEEGNINCYSSVLEEGKLLSIETEEELKMIDKMLQTITASTKLKYQMVIPEDECI